MNGSEWNLAKICNNHHQQWQGDHLRTSMSNISQNYFHLSSALPHTHTHTDARTHARTHTHTHQRKFAKTDVKILTGLVQEAPVTDETISYPLPLTIHYFIWYRTSTFRDDGLLGENLRKWQLRHGQWPKLFLNKLVKVASVLVNLAESPSNNYTIINNQILVHLTGYIQ